MTYFVQKLSKNCETYFSPIWEGSRALSSFAFQSFEGFIEIKNKNIFSIPARDSWWLHQQGTAIMSHSKKIAKIALFNPCMKFDFLGGQMPSFEVPWKLHSVILSKILCLGLHPSAYPGE